MREIMVKCPHCLAKNSIKKLSENIEQWDEENEVECAHCDKNFILSAWYVGWEANDHFDVGTYLKVRGLEIPQGVSKYAVKCWLEDWFSEDCLYGIDYIPDAWSDATWLKARDFAKQAFLLSKRVKIEGPLNENTPDVCRELIGKFVTKKTDIPPHAEGCFCLMGEESK